MRYCTLYLVIHSSASQRPWVRIPEITFTSFRSICSHCAVSWYLESHAHLGGHQPALSSTVPSQAEPPVPTQPGLPSPHSPRSPQGAFLSSPEALAVEAGLVGCPGGVPARVLLRVGAADLVWGDGTRLKAQGLVVGTLCGTREKHLRDRSGSVFWVCLHTYCEELRGLHCFLFSLIRTLGMLLS